MKVFSLSFAGQEIFQTLSIWMLVRYNYKYNFILFVMTLSKIHIFLHTQLDNINKKDKTVEDNKCSLFYAYQILRRRYIPDVKSSDNLCSAGNDNFQVPRIHKFYAFYTIIKYTTMSCFLSRSPFFLLSQYVCKS